MTFRKLINFLGDCLGSHQVPVRPRARELADFLRADAVHHDLVKPLVREIYRANRCGHLDAAVYREPTLEVLARFRLELLRRPGTDVDQFNFAESLCENAAAFFDKANPTPVSMRRSHRAAPAPAQVIPFRRAPHWKPA